MQTFLYHYFRIATLVAWLIADEVSFDIFSENFFFCIFLFFCSILLVIYKTLQVLNIIIKLLTLHTTLHPL